MAQQDIVGPLGRNKQGRFGFLDRNQQILTKFKFTYAFDANLIVQSVHSPALFRTFGLVHVKHLLEPSTTAEQNSGKVLHSFKKVRY